MICTPTNEVLGSRTRVSKCNPSVAVNRLHSAPTITNQFPTEQYARHSPDKIAMTAATFAHVMI